MLFGNKVGSREGFVKEFCWLNVLIWLFIFVDVVELLVIFDFEGIDDLMFDVFFFESLLFKIELLFESVF